MQRKPTSTNAGNSHTNPPIRHGHHFAGHRVLASRRGSELSRREALEFSRWCSHVMLPKRLAVESEAYLSYMLHIVRKSFDRWRRRTRTFVALRRCLRILKRHILSSTVETWKNWAIHVDAIGFRFVVNPCFAIWRASIQLVWKQRAKRLQRALPLTRVALVRRTFLKWHDAVKSSQRKYAFALQGIAKRHWYALECKHRFGAWKKFVQLEKSRAGIAASWKQKREDRGLATCLQAMRVFGHKSLGSRRIARVTFDGWRRVTVVSLHRELLSRCLHRLKLYASMRMTLRRVFHRLLEATRVYYVSEVSSMSLWSDLDMYCEEGEDMKSQGDDCLDLSMTVFREDFLSNASRHRKWRERRLLHGEVYDNEDNYDYEYASTDVNKSRRVLLNHEVKRHALKNLRRSNKVLSDKVFASEHQKLIDHMNAVYRFDNVQPLLMKQASDSSTWDNIQTQGYAKHISIVERLASHQVPDDLSRTEGISRHKRPL